MADQKEDLTKNVNKPDAQSGQTSATPSAGQTGSSSTGSGSVTGAATAAAKSFYDQAKETAGQAYGAVTDKAASALDEKKSTLSDGLSTVADSIRQVGSNMSEGLVQGSNTENALANAASKYSNTAATKISDLAGYFERTDVRTMARDLEGYARRNPAIFLGAAFGIGMLAARFLKSSPPRGEYGEPRRLSTPAGSFDAGRGNTELRDEESGQGLQMAGQSFEPTNRETSSTGTSGTTSATGRETGGATKKTGRTSSGSSKGTGSDPLPNAM